MMQPNSGYKTDELTCNINICYLYDIVTTSKKDYSSRPIKLLTPWAGIHVLGHGHIGHRMKLYSKGMQIWDSFTGVEILFDTQVAVKTTEPCSFTYSVFNNKNNEYF